MPPTSASPKRGFTTSTITIFGLLGIFLLPKFTSLFIDQYFHLTRSTTLGLEYIPPTVGPVTTPTKKILVGNVAVEINRRMRVDRDQIVKAVFTPDPNESTVFSFPSAELQAPAFEVRESSQPQTRGSISVRQRTNPIRWEWLLSPKQAGEFIVSIRFKMSPGIIQIKPDLTAAAQLSANYDSLSIPVSVATEIGLSRWWFVVLSTLGAVIGGFIGWGLLEPLKKLWRKIFG